MSSFKTVLFILLILVGVWASWSYVTGRISEQKQQQYNAGYDEGYDTGFRDGQYEVMEVGVDEAEYDKVLSDYETLVEDYNNLVNEANSRLNASYQRRQPIWCSTNTVSGYSSTWCF